MKIITGQKTHTFVTDLVRLSGAYIKGVHTQESWEVTYVATGGGLLTIGKHVQPYESESLILIPPGIEHGWTFPDEAEVTAASMFFSSGSLEAIAAALPETADSIRSILALTSPVVYNREVSRKTGSLLAESAVCDDFDRTLTCLRILIDLSNMSDGRSVGDVQYKNATERKTDSIVAFIRSNFQKNLSLTEVSAVLGFNKSALCTFVKKNLGMTFTELINKYRLKTARHLLETSELTVSQIAYEVGFSNGSYLNRLFKRKFGVSPLAFRKQKQQKQPDKTLRGYSAGWKSLNSIYDLKE